MSILKKHPFVMGLITAFVVAILYRWLLGFVPSLSSPSIPSRTVHSKFDIVLSHFLEDPGQVRGSLEVIKKIPAIAQLNPRVIIYTKGPVGDTDVQLESLRDSLGADNLYPLPNRGRESDTYLTHIIDHYHELADHTFFAQAAIHDLDAVSHRLLVHFNTTVGVMSLGDHFSCRCEQCFHTWSPAAEGFKRIPQLYTIFNEDFCPPEGLLLSFRAQIIVSRDRILRNTRRKFQWLRGVLTDMSHFVHEDVGPEDDIWYDKDKAVDNPIFGHTIERSWLLMFGCNDLSIIEGCEMLRGYQDESSRCACYNL